MYQNWSLPIHDKQSIWRPHLGLIPPIHGQLFNSPSAHQYPISGHLQTTEFLRRHFSSSKVLPVSLRPDGEVSDLTHGIGIFEPRLHHEAGTGSHPRKKPSRAKSPRGQSGHHSNHFSPESKPSDLNVGYDRVLPLNLRKIRLACNDRNQNSLFDRDHTVTMQKQSLGSSLGPQSSSLHPETIPSSEHIGPLSRAVNVRTSPLPSASLQPPCPVSDRVKVKLGRPPKRAPKMSLPPLYIFIRNLLHNRSYNPQVVSWVNEKDGIFKISNTMEFARTWGRMKVNRNAEMNYEKMSRAMRYHYGNRSRKGHLAMVEKKRLVYRFGEKAIRWRPGEVVLKNCQIHEFCKQSLCLWTKE